MAKLDSDFTIPLKVVTARLNHMKNSLPGLLSEIEKRAIRNLEQKKSNDKNNDGEIRHLITWDDWIYAALDINHRLKTSTNTGATNSLLDKVVLESENQNKFNTLVDQLHQQQPKNLFGTNNLDSYKQAMQLAKKRLNMGMPAWAQGREVGEEIPQDLIDELPLMVGELCSLGNWMLTKNVYRFDDVVIAEVLKSEFEGELPTFLINLPEIATYIQTDNSNLAFQGKKIVGVIFSSTSLNEQDVLLSTVYFDTGLSKSIPISIIPDHDIEDCLSDFVDTFNYNYEYERDENSVEFNELKSLQKTLINLVLWFAQDKPETVPLIPENLKEKTGFKIIKKNRRLFEAEKYKPYRVGSETGVVFRKVYEQLEEAKKNNQGTGKRSPHLRKSHWHLYWYGPKGQFERYDFKLLPITIIGGTPKE